MKYSKYLKLSHKLYIKRYEKFFKTGNGKFILPAEWNSKHRRLPRYFCYFIDSTAYLRIRHFAGSTQQNNFYKKCFDSIQKAASTTLIIDLRNNGGGRTSNFENILSFLSHDSIVKANKVTLRLNESLWQKSLKVLKTGDSSYYLKFKYHTVGDTFTLLTKNELTIYTPQSTQLFAGKVVVIVNSATFSAANAFATIIKNNNLGTIMGEETGGMTNSSGDPENIKLPFSKTFLSIPTKQIFQSNDSIRSGLKPDMEINIGHGNIDVLIKKIVCGMNKDK